MIGLIVGFVAIIFIIAIAKSILPFLMGAAIFILLGGGLIYLLFNYTWITIVVIVLFCCVAYKIDEKIFEEFDEVFKSDNPYDIHLGLRGKNKSDVNSIIGKYKKRLKEFGFGEERVNRLIIDVIVLDFMDFSRKNNNSASDKIIYEKKIFLEDFSGKYKSFKNEIGIDFLNANIKKFGFLISEPQGGDILVVEKLTEVDVDDENVIELD